MTEKKRKQLRDGSEFFVRSLCCRKSDLKQLQLKWTKKMTSAVDVLVGGQELLRREKYEKALPS